MASLDVKKNKRVDVKVPLDQLKTLNGSACYRGNKSVLARPISQINQPKGVIKKKKKKTRNFCASREFIKKYVGHIQ